MSNLYQMCKSSHLVCCNMLHVSKICITVSCSWQVWQHSNNSKTNEYSDATENIFNSYVKCHQQICIQFSNSLIHTHQCIISCTSAHYDMKSAKLRCQQHGKRTTLTTIIYCDKQLTQVIFDVPILTASAWASFTKCFNSVQHRFCDTFCTSFVFSQSSITPLWHLIVAKKIVSRL